MYQTIIVLVLMAISAAAIGAITYHEKHKWDKYMK